MNKNGVVKILPILLIITTIGVISFLLISSTAPFKGGLTNPPKFPSSAATSEEEFVGPFPSWRQVQCTGGNDTTLLQNELNTLGRSGSPVLYIKAGTCRITATLKLGQGAGGPGGVENVTVIGHHPSDTKILWAGPANGRMIEVNGVGHSRFGRLTWDGGGTADMVYIDLTSSGINFFPTANRHEDEVFQNIKGVAFYLGARDTGTSEWEYMRMKFIGPMQAGIFLANGNTLDHWVWDSEFRNVAHGITNYIPERTGANGQGGDMAVNRSVFLNGGVDIGFGNVQPFGASRWNYSRGSKIHVSGWGVGRVNSGWTSQGETVLDPTSPNPISMGGSNGPLGILDGTFRGGKPEGMIGVFEGYCSSNCMGDLWAAGNTFSNSSTSQYAIPFPVAGRIHVNIDDKFGQTIVDPGPPVLPPAPVNSSLPVIEVQNGNVAAALSQAGNQRVIVHIPHGKYLIQQTLQVGPNVILTGDGYGATQLEAGPNASPILRLLGPSHAVIRDLSLRGWTQNGRVSQGIVIDNADQPGGLVHAEFSMLQANKAGWELLNLSQTTVDLFDDYNGANTHCGNDGAGPDVDYKVTNSKLHIFNGAGASSDAQIDQHGGEIVDMTHYYEGNPGCVPAMLITPNSSGTLVINEGNFAPSRGGIDTSTYQGSFTMVNFANTLALDSTNLTGRKFGPNSLVMGFAYGNAGDNVAPTFQSPYIYFLGQHVAPNNPMPEISAGVTNRNQFIKDHLAPLRAAKPLSLEPRPANVTDVRMYRVGGELLTSAFKVQGNPPQPSPTGATPVPTPTATPLPSPTRTPTPTPTAISSPAPSPSSCQGADLDNDRDVDIFDYNILVGNFGKTGVNIPGDIDKDNDVDIFDYNILVGNFGKSAC